MRVLLFSIFCFLVKAQDCKADYDKVKQYPYLFYSAVTVMNSYEAFPPIGYENVVYTAPLSCLGHYGPIGSNGPLGQYGPLGDDSWSPASWISGTGLDWSTWIDKIQGPLGIKGPLGPDGPVSDHWYSEVCPCINSFAHHTMNGGVFSILGPMGPLGALGPLGRIGAHGYARNQNGQYVTKGGKIMRTVSVPYSSTVNRTFSLYEEYAHRFALTSKSSLDTSWYVHGVRYNDTNEDLHTYTFTSTEEQFIYIVVVPYTLIGWAFPPTFKLTVTAGHGPIVSDAATYIQWVVVKVDGGNTKIKVQVEGDAIAETMAYSLFVTGSTGYFPKTDIIGEYQKVLA